MDEDDDIDTSGIPDFAPMPTWAKGPASLIKTVNAFDEIAVPEITRENLIAQLYLEASDRGSRNQAARIRAWELIAELKGWKESHTDTKDEDTDNLTQEEIKAVAEEFAKNY